MTHRLTPIGIVCWAFFAGCSASLEPGDTAGESRNPDTSGGRAAARSRMFRFDYGFQLTDLPAAAKVRVWMPVPPSNRDQTVTELERRLPAKGTVAKEPKYGNAILYVEPRAPASRKLDFRVSYRVERREVRLRASGNGDTKLTPEERKRFLAANAKVPLTGKPLALIADLRAKKEALALARQLYDRVDAHVKYDKSKPGYGNGDVDWVCDSRFGNCTDFHSLFISLARAKGLPARFEIGFPIPTKRGEGTIGGYHCWAYFFAGKRGWVPVDISEADKHPGMKDYYFGNLTENRVAFATGRDIELVPRQAGPPLNYFVYPCVEVNGKPWPKEKVKLSFGYKDL